MRLIPRIFCHRRDAIDTEPEASPKRLSPKCLRPPLPNLWIYSPTTKSPYEDGLILVSSDGQRFQVEWSMLESASQVFADARVTINCEAKASTPDTLPVIHLTDPEFEKASVVLQFLHLASTSFISSFYIWSEDPLDLIPLFLFLRKWECADLEDGLVHAVDAAMDWLRYFPLRTYILGARTGHDAICHTVLWRSWEHLRVYDPWWSEDSQPGSDTLYPWSPTSWSAECWWELANVPRVYVAALLQAAAASCDNRNDVFDCVMTRYTRFESQKGFGPAGC